MTMRRAMYRISYQIYSIARKLLRSLIPSRAVRYALGPVFGRVVYRLSAERQAPLSIRGHHMYIADGQDYPPIDMTADKYEMATTRLLEKLLTPGMGVVDIGAHVGYYSLLAARAVGPTGRVYSFEPEPHNFALLLKNISLNGYTNIVARQNAITDRCGQVDLFVSALDNGSHSLHHVGKPERGNVRVDAVTLDFALAREGWPRIDLIKMDIEGSELKAVAGMRECLKRFAALKLIVEMCPSILERAGVRAEELVETLRGFGLKFYVLLGGAVIPQEEVDLPALLGRLIRSGDYVNLLWIKGEGPVDNLPAGAEAAARATWRAAHG